MDGWIDKWMDHFLKILPGTEERKGLSERVKKPGTILQVDSE